MHTNGYTLNETGRKEKNLSFERYYQTVFPWGESEYGEYGEFEEYLRSPLPICVRLCKNNQVVFDKCLHALHNLAQVNRSEDDGCHEKLAEEITWLVKSCSVEAPYAWQINATQKLLNTGNIKLLYNVLIEHIALGHITRQEVVSMLPVVFLDVQPQHAILDLCAAPGSKTTQMLEMLSRRTTPDSGYVIANDVSYKRLCVLMHQCCRWTQNAQHLIVTKHCAMSFPSNTRFDRILCDVPCSGDGTLRKSPDLWQRWKPADAHAMHKQQIAILKRALELLKPGGRMVYSTCSMNPIENEAVVLHCLNNSKRSFKVKSVSEFVPNMRCTPGLSNWKVMLNNGDWFSSIEEVPQDVKRHVLPSMFPVQNTHKSIQIENAVRILPHFQNTGGFFIAVIEDCNDMSDSTDMEPKRTKHSKKVDEPCFTTLTAQNRRIIQEKIGLKSNFPWDRLVQRREEGKRTNIFMLTHTGADLVRNTAQLNFQNVGVKALEVQHEPVEAVSVYQEIASFIVSYTSEERVVPMSAGELLALIEASSTPAKAATDQSVSPQLENQRDFFIATSHLSESSPVYIAFSWNRFLKCWRPKMSLEQRKEILKSLSLANAP